MLTPHSPLAQRPGIFALGNCSSSNFHLGKHSSEDEDTLTEALASATKRRKDQLSQRDGISRLIAAHQANIERITMQGSAAARHNHDAGQNTRRRMIDAHQLSIKMLSGLNKVVSVDVMRRQAQCTFEGDWLGIDGA